MEYPVGRMTVVECLNRVRMRERTGQLHFLFEAADGEIIGFVGGSSLSAVSLRSRAWRAL